MNVYIITRDKPLKMVAALSSERARVFYKTTIEEFIRSYGEAYPGVPPDFFLKQSGGEFDRVTTVCSTTGRTGTIEHAKFSLHSVEVVDSPLDFLAEAAE